LKKIQPRISHVEILLKRGRYQNEMNRFRYDVILYIDHHGNKPLEKINWHNWTDEQYSFEKIIHHLGEKKPQYFAIKNIPNIHTAGLNTLTKYVPGSNTQTWQDELHGFLRETLIHAVDPEALIELAESHSYYAKATWSQENPHDCFDILFFKRNEKINNNHSIQIRELGKVSNDTNELQTYANSPLKMRKKRRLLNQLKKFLQFRLPDYMIPQNFIILSKLPVTANGKIDRNALPKTLTFIKSNKYIPPQTTTQKILADIWSRILGITKVGIYDNYYEMGGTSLLAVQLLLEIQNNFNVELGIQDVILNSPTIAKLSLLIDQKSKTAITGELTY
jgi:hypothetical protein